ncbi:MAG: hypothetical protein AAF471_01950 [Myxococcota bacterium]
MRDDGLDKVRDFSTLSFLPLFGARGKLQQESPVRYPTIHQIL